MNPIRSAIRREIARALSPALLVAVSLAPLPVVHAAPTGGTVVAGDASITATSNGTTINQTSQNAILNWQSFDIGVGETVSFVQPNSRSVALNRVLGADPSRILGQLSANGTVFLVNPNGVLFGADARVNVGGLVASTRDIANDDFLAGDYQFSGTGDGAILNHGSIDADGGYVALLGANVSNEGVISARLGTVALAAGNAVTLDVIGDGLLNVGIDAGAIDALARNGGVLRADGGQVLLTARSAGDLLQTAVNNTGLIRAQTIENRGGTIKLLGDMQSGTTNVAGTLDASAPDGGNGGFIETSAAHVQIAPDAVITTAASQGASGLWLIDPFDFTIAASGGDMTGATLSASLASGNVTIQSTAGATGVDGNVNVNDTVSWSANRLTLHALNNININTAMHGSGTAQLALEYGQGAVAANNTSRVNVRAPVNLPAGNNFSTRQGSDGAVVNYTVITSLGAAGSTTGTDLQGINGNLTDNYALGSDIDASATSGWNSGAGFSPIGTPSTFTGRFDGLGHVVSTLTVNRPGTNNIGLFGVANNATIRNVGVIDSSVTGQTNVGLLMGNSQSGTFSNVYSTGTVNGVTFVGGLMGLHNGGDIDRAHSTASVRGTSNLVGGLVGQARFYGTITQSYATGAVNGTGASQVGGLAGQIRFVNLSDSYATGDVTGTSQVGGLVGFLDMNDATRFSVINRSYSTGAVIRSNGSATSFGGLVGTRSSGTVTNSYWNTTTSGRANAVGSGSGTGATGLTTTQMRTASSFSGWNFSDTWIVYDSYTYPLLRTFMTALTVTAADAVKTYDGQAYSGGNGPSYSTTPNGSNLFGTLTYGGTAQGAVNAGTYTLTAAGGLYSNQQGYIISYGNGSGTLTIDPAVLTVTAASPDKVYDGNTLADVTLTLNGLIGSETLGVSGTAEFNSREVLSANLVTVTNLSLADGGNGGLAGNYVLAAGPVTAAASITPRALTVVGQTAMDRMHDGTTVATLTGGLLDGIVAGDTVLLNESGFFASAEVGTDIAVTATNTLSGAAATNYSLIQPTGLTADITAPPPPVVPPVVEVPPVSEVPQAPETPETPPATAAPGYQQAVGLAVSNSAATPVSTGAPAPVSVSAPAPGTSASVVVRHDLAGLNLSIEGDGVQLPSTTRHEDSANDEQ